MAKILPTRILPFNRDDDHYPFGSVRDGLSVISNTALNTQAGINALTQNILDFFGATTVRDGETKAPIDVEWSSAFFFITRHLASLTEEGIGWYREEQPYFIGSIVYDTVTNALYISSTDENTGNPVTDTLNWTLLFPFDNRTEILDTDYSVLITDRVIAQAGTLTAPRTITLPSASSFKAGVELIVIDESSTCNATNYIRVIRDGSDLINGRVSFDIIEPYESLKLVSNGVDKWTLTNRQPKKTGFVSKNFVAKTPLETAQDTEIQFDDYEGESDDGSVIISLLGTYTKNQTVWSDGGDGLVPSGLTLASLGEYYIFAIAKQDGTASIILDSDIDATNAKVVYEPAGYVYKKIICWTKLVNVGTDFVGFEYNTRTGDYIYNEPLLISNTIIPFNTTQTYTFNTPKNYKAISYSNILIDFTDENNPNTASYDPQGLFVFPTNADITNINTSSSLYQYKAIERDAFFLAIAIFSPYWHQTNTFD